VFKVFFDMITINSGGFSVGTRIFQIKKLNIRKRSQSRMGGTTRTREGSTKNTSRTLIRSVEVNP
jgi:hypothetical protein